MQTYLDHNASAPLLREARSAMIAALEADGNPSSIHQAGRNARKIIEDARSVLAEIVSIAPKQIVFTSCATESAQLALGRKIRVGSMWQHLSHLYVSAIEHPCTLAGGRFPSDQITKFGVTKGGMIDLNELRIVLSHHDHSKGAPMVAAMLANNETGVIQPIAEIGALVKEYNGYLCVDAVQAFGKIPVDFNNLNADFVLLSAHKIGGPKGAGALLMMNEAITPHPLLTGGSQENRLRAGTENTAAIAGFGAAAQKVNSTVDHHAVISGLRDEIETGLEEISRRAGNETPLPMFFGIENKRLPNTSLMAVAGTTAQSALIALDLAGISVSSGSACASGRVNQSHVLSAMGVDPDLAECALRISIGQDTTKQQTGHFISTWKQIIERRINASS